MSAKKIKGRCHCGRLEYEVELPSDFCAHCHCESCRRLSGAPFVTWTSVPLQRFSLLSDEKDLHWYASSPFIEWGSCKNCASLVLYRVIKEGHAENPKPDRMYLVVTSLNQPLDRQPAVHVSYEEKMPWLDMNDGLPKYRGKGIERIDVH